MSKSKPIKIEVDVREFDTMLAALRYYQRYADDECEETQLIATEHGDALNDDEIDRLCQRIN